MKTPATNFEALLGQARDCGLTLEFATAYEINVALDEADCCGGGGVEGDFGYLSNLSIYVPNNEPLPELYYSLFNNVVNLSIRGKVNSIAFPEGTLKQVKTMSNAFQGCSSITSITFPNGALTQVTNLMHTFSGCVVLTSITFPEGALTVLKNMENIFQYCSSLSSIVFPEGSLRLVSRTGYAFLYCTSLTSLTFPEGAFKLLNYIISTFFRCNSLQDLTIHNLPNINLTNIGFNTCTSLTLQSLQNILNALPTTTSGYKCTIGTTNLAKLSDTDIQIATDKGWTLN